MVALNWQSSREIGKTSLSEVLPMFNSKGTVYSAVTLFQFFRITKKSKILYNNKKFIKIYLTLVANFDIFI